MLSVLAHQGHSSDQDALAAFQAGCDQLGKRGRSLALWDGDDHDIGQLHAALSTLMRLPLPTRVEILRAAETIAAHDGVLRPSEKELVRTLATCLGVGFGIEG